nr:hypothetical protein BaRGS_003847 [Batillaria attramentaria]
MGRRAPSRDGVKQNLQPSPEKLDIYHKASPEGSEEDLSLCRKLRLCVALLPSEAALVFMQLYMLPVLQALGVPVSMETLSGIFSGSLALATLPMLGWLSDGGSNPNGRKKPAVVASVSVYVVGTLLIVSGCALHMWGGADLTQVTEHQFSVTQHTSIGPSTSSALPTSIDTTRPVARIYGKYY